MCLILNKDFIFSENTCVYVLKPSDNKNRTMSVMQRKVSEVSSKQQSTVLVKGTINSVWNEMGLLGQQQSPLPKNSPASLHALADTNNKKDPEDVTNRGNGTWGIWELCTIFSIFL